MELQAGFWYEEGRFEEAKSEVLRAAEVYEGIGDTKDVEDCKNLLRDIKEEMVVSGESGFSGEPLEPMSLPTLSNSPF